jgi:ubiquitin-protein ligase
MKMNFPNPDDILNFTLTIEPDEGMYKGGAFHFNFSVNQNFPHDPPKVKCTQKIYHPNIDLEGNVCLNILREDWKPVLNLNAVIVGMQVGLGHRRTRSVSFAGLTFGFAA